MGVLWEGHADSGVREELGDRKRLWWLPSSGEKGCVLEAVWKGGGRPGVKDSK